MYISKTHLIEEPASSKRANAEHQGKSGLKMPAVSSLQKKQLQGAALHDAQHEQVAAGYTNDAVQFSTAPRQAGVIQTYSHTAANPVTNEETDTAPQGITQRYTAGSKFKINGKNVKGTLSETGQFFLPDGDGTIYGTSQPRACHEIGTGAYNFNGLSYRLYAPGLQFLDDCLHTAEEIVNNKILKYGSGTYTRETTTNYVFGQSDKRNIEIAESAKLNSAGSVDGSAAPGVGNAFVIIDTEFESNPSKRSPYHAAGVIAVDGNDRITMEVFANGGSLVNRLTDSSLSIYTVGGGAASFHGYWSTGYFKDYSTITIVVKAK